MTTLTRSTLAQNSWQTIYDLFTSASGLTDPASRGISRDNWVFASFPDTYTSGTKPFPIVVISPAKVNLERKSVDGNLREASIIFSVELWAKRADHIDPLVDSVQDVLLTAQNGTLLSAGLKRLDFVGSNDYVPTTRNNSHFHVKRMQFSFRTYPKWSS